MGLEVELCLRVIYRHVIDADLVSKAPSALSLLHDFAFGYPAGNELCNRIMSYVEGNPAE